MKMKNLKYELWELFWDQNDDLLRWQVSDQARDQARDQVCRPIWRQMRSLSEWDIMAQVTEQIRK